ncbi:MAG: hypothetical protein JJ975_06755 [Bacteroidia bacterium]|nr:hypothetical protein [Bacteroidia bacterium]
MQNLLAFSQVHTPVAQLSFVTSFDINDDFYRRIPTAQRFFSGWFPQKGGGYFIGLDTGYRYFLAQRFNEKYEPVSFDSIPIPEEVSGFLDQRSEPKVSSTYVNIDSNEFQLFLNQRSLLLFTSIDDHLILKEYFNTQRLFQLVGSFGCKWDNRLFVLSNTHIRRCKKGVDTLDFYVYDFASREKTKLYEAPYIDNFHRGQHFVNSTIHQNRFHHIDPVSLRYTRILLDTPFPVEQVTLGDSLKERFVDHGINPIQFLHESPYKGIKNITSGDRVSNFMLTSLPFEDRWLIRIQTKATGRIQDYVLDLHTDCIKPEAITVKNPDLFTEGFEFTDTNFPLDYNAFWVCRGQDDHVIFFNHHLNEPLKLPISQIDFLSTFQDSVLKSGYGNFDVEGLVFRLTIK